MRHRLRARLVVPVALTLMVLGLAGCGAPSGLDGDLVNGWSAMTEPTTFTPAAGTCHLANFAIVGTRGVYEEANCEVKHRSETTYVGTYAEAPTPPIEGSTASRTAYQTCDEQTSKFVGAPWRTARLWIGVTHPSAAAWTGGARWFRCEVLEISSIEDDGGLVLRLGSIRDALLADASDLRLTCYAIQLDSTGAIDTMPASDCTTRHNAEFVGVWDAGALNYPTGDTQWATFHTGCRTLIAKFAGVPDDKDLQYRTGVVSLPGGQDVWALGDRGVRCYLWLDGAALTTSLKGKGPRGMPIQYK